MILVSWWIISFLCVATSISAYVNNRSQPEYLNNYWAVLVAGSNKWMHYQDQDVRKDVFLYVLQGRKEKVKKIGSQRVVLSYQRDNILIYYSGHGSEDFVEFPGSGKNNKLYSNELVKVFKHLRGYKKYQNILMYLESTHSRNFFDTLPQHLNVMAITAGAPDEDNWGIWCNTSIQPCRAGLFSYTWISSAENATNSMSVFNHYDLVQRLVAKTGKQHPQLYGDRKIGNLPITDFIGYMKNQYRGNFNQINY